MHYAVAKAPAEGQAGAARRCRRTGMGAGFVSKCRGLNACCNLLPAPQSSVGHRAVGITIPLILRVIFAEPAALRAVFHHLHKGCDGSERASSETITRRVPRQIARGRHDIVPRPRNGPSLCAGAGGLGPGQMLIAAACWPSAQGF